MTPQDEQVIQQWANHPATRACRLDLVLDSSSAADLINRFCRRLQELAALVTLKTITQASFRKPAMLTGAYQNIAYQAIPQGTELSIFLEALCPSEQTPPRLAPELEPLVSRISWPLDLTLYISPHCPHCPQAVRQLLPLTTATAHIRLAIVDVTLFAQQAQSDQIRSVPTLVLNDQLRWTGQLDLEEVLTLCSNRDPALLSPASLKGLLEAGDAGQAAQMMIDHQRIFPALIELLVDPQWSVRLGAMVIVEYLAEEPLNLATQLAEPLWQRFAELDLQIQGDLAHVLGLIGSPAARRYLKLIANGPYAQAVQEAAAEALAAGALEDTADR